VKTIILVLVTSLFSVLAMSAYTGDRNSFYGVYYGYGGHNYGQNGNRYKHYKKHNSYRYKHHANHYGHHNDSGKYFATGLIIGGVLGHALHSDQYVSSHRVYRAPTYRRVIRRSYPTYYRTNDGKCYLVNEHSDDHKSLKRVPKMKCR